MIRADAAHDQAVLEQTPARRKAHSSRLLAATIVLAMALAAGAVQQLAGRLDAGRAAPPWPTAAAWTN